MKRKLMNVGGIILFYSVLVFGVLLLNLRFSYLNKNIETNINNSYIAMNK